MLRFDRACNMEWCSFSNSGGIGIYPTFKKVLYLSDMRQGSQK